jgi:hypothetical protein
MILIQTHSNVFVKNVAAAFALYLSSVAEGYKVTGDPVATLQDSAERLSCELSILHVSSVVIIALTPPTTARL